MKNLMGIAYFIVEHRIFFLVHNALLVAVGMWLQRVLINQ